MPTGSGAVGYNQALSERRSRLVLQEMEAAGIDPSRVAFESVGENHADGADPGRPARAAQPGGGSQYLLISGLATDEHQPAVPRHRRFSFGARGNACTAGPSPASLLRLDVFSPRFTEITELTLSLGWERETQSTSSKVGM